TAMRRRNLVTRSATAARVIQACGVGRSPILAGATAATSLANGPDRIFGAVRAAVGEGQRLLKAGGLELATTPAGKRFALDLVKPAFVVEHRGCRVAAVAPHDAELTTVEPLDAVANVDFHLATRGY